jgi:two-component system, cell cycle response regulator
MPSWPRGDLAPGSYLGPANRGTTPELTMNRAPLVLLVSGDEWEARALTSVLAPQGYAVLRAYTAEQALSRAAAADPDAVFISARLEDMESGGLCRALLDGQRVARSAPIIYLAPVHVTREERLGIMAAGAWDVVQLPIDADELVVRLERLVQAKLHVDQLREAGLVDHLTGLYTREGAVRRVREVGAAAERFGRPIACIVLTPLEGTEADAPVPAEEVVALAQRLRRGTRGSDVVARIGASDFAIIAPDTPPDGADILADRLRAQAAEPANGERRFRAGVYAVSDPGDAQLDPAELIRRATSASRGDPPD